MDSIAKIEIFVFLPVKLEKVTVSKKYVFVTIKSRDK
jgi:hypothetical protein